MCRDQWAEPVLFCPAIGEPLVTAILLWRGGLAASNKSRPDGQRGFPEDERRKRKRWPSQRRIDSRLGPCPRVRSDQVTSVRRNIGRLTRTKPTKGVAHQVRARGHRPGENRHQHEPRAQPKLPPAAWGEEAHLWILRRKIGRTQREFDERHLAGPVNPCTNYPGLRCADRAGTSNRGDSTHYSGMRPSASSRSQSRISGQSVAQVPKSAMCR